MLSWRDADVGASKSHFSRFYPENNPIYSTFMRPINAFSKTSIPDKQEQKARLKWPQNILKFSIKGLARVIYFVNLDIQYSRMNKTSNL